MSEQEKNSGLCPINYIYFTEQSNTTNLNSDDFNVIPFQDETALVYSKNNLDSLPIASIRMANSEKCYNKGLDKLFYPVERDTRSRENCLLIHEDDSRYEKLGSY